jgi:hypothetical protein
MTRPSIDLTRVHLDAGAHDGPDDGHCFMEVVSMFAEEPFTDQPQCVSPYLRRFGTALNDRAADEQRQDLKRFIPMLVGTAGDGLDEKRRWYGADHVVRVVAPKWLERAGLGEHAAALRAVAPIVDRASCDAAYEVCCVAREAARELRVRARKPLYDAVYRAVRDRRSTDAYAAAATAAAATAYAAAAAADAADAAAYAADAAYATAAATKKVDYWAVRNAVYERVLPVFQKRYASVFAESWPDALDLYDQLIRIGQATT